MRRGGIGIECKCPEKRVDHKTCVRCGGYETVWRLDPGELEPVDGDTE